MQQRGYRTARRIAEDKTHPRVGWFSRCCFVEVGTQLQVDSNNCTMRSLTLVPCSSPHSTPPPLPPWLLGTTSSIPDKSKPEKSAAAQPPPIPWSSAIRALCGVLLEVDCIDLRCVRCYAVAHPRQATTMNYGDRN
jgi:hypothetical protein